MSHLPRCPLTGSLLFDCISTVALSTVFEADEQVALTLAVVKARLNRQIIGTSLSHIKAAGTVSVPGTFQIAQLLGVVTLVKGHFGVLI